MKRYRLPLIAEAPIPSDVVLPQPIEYYYLASEVDARIAEMEKALRFYADKRRYQGLNQHPIPDDPYQPENMRSYMYDTCRDNGELARKALGL